MQTIGIPMIGSPMNNFDLYIKMREVQMMLSVLARMWHQNMSQHLINHGEGLSSLQYGVMRIIDHHTMTLSELSRKLIVDPSTLVPVVDALEKRSLIQRQRDPNDRRRQPLALTEQGRTLLNSIPVFGEDDDFMKSMQIMGEPKIDHLLALLGELIQNTNQGESYLNEIGERIDIYRRSLKCDKDA